MWIKLDLQNKRALFFEQKLHFSTFLNISIYLLSFTDFLCVRYFCVLKQSREEFLMLERLTLWEIHQLYSYILASKFFKSGLLIMKWSAVGTSAANSTLVESKMRLPYVKCYFFVSDNFRAIFQCVKVNEIYSLKISSGTVLVTEKNWLFYWFTYSEKLYRILTMWRGHC